MSLHEIWASTIQVALAAWMLYNQLGAVFVAPMGVVIACFIGLVIVMKFTGDSQRAWMAGVQKRVGLTATVISSMKDLKMSGLSVAVCDFVQKLRVEELVAGSRFRKIAIIAALFGYIPMLVSPPLTFAFAQRTLDATRMFTSLSYLLLLTNPLAQVFQFIPQLLSGLACLGRIQAFFAWTAKYHSAYHLGGTAAQVQASYYEIRAKLKKTPIDGPDGPMIGPDELDDTILLGGYLNAVWPAFAQALSQYLNDGSSDGLVSQFQQWGAQSENTFAVYNAVECADVNWPRNWAKWQSDTVHVYQTAPFEAWDNAWFNAACAFWPVQGPAKPFQVNGAKLPPVLMLQGTLDAATPYAGAQDAHKLLPTARMVVVEGGGNHGQSLESPSDTCVQNYLNTYLATGAVPDKPGLVNATCAPTPNPSPLSPGGRPPYPRAWEGFAPPYPPHGRTPHKSRRPPRCG